ncbi:MAG: outer membrane beta-barrel protein, partial [Bradyrhizobium sp.]|nr:outer membrane beta-barrel protein [Bradyrhizobium sp.]
HSANSTWLNTPYKAPVASTAYDWSGFYIGANAGYGWGTSNATASTTGVGNPDAEVFHESNGTFGFNPKGFIGGMQGGFNYQTGMLVYGLEADAQFSNLEASRDTGFLPAHAGQTGRLRDTLDPSWQVTIRPRLGVAFDRTLLYATGGMAISEVRLSQLNEICQVANCPASKFDGSVSSTKVGWVLGGGIEHGLIGNWTVKAEYLYVDLGSVDLRRNLIDDVGGTNRVFPGVFVDSTANLKAHIARFGFNYRFNPGTAGN